VSAGRVNGVWGRAGAGEVISGEVEGLLEGVDGVEGPLERVEGLL